MCLDTRLCLVRYVQGIVQNGAEVVKEHKRKKDRGTNSIAQFKDGCFNMCAVTWCGLCLKQSSVLCIHTEYLQFIVEATLGTERFFEGITCQWNLPSVGLGMNFHCYHRVLKQCKKIEHG